MPCLSRGVGQGTVRQTTFEQGEPGKVGRGVSLGANSTLEGQTSPWEQLHGDDHNTACRRGCIRNPLVRLPAGFQEVAREDDHNEQVGPSP